MDTIVMSVGGSLIVPDGIDTDFLTKLKVLVEEEIARRGRRFIIIAGGGRTARTYQMAARAVTELEPEDLDWLGIHATRLNGHLLRTIFKEVAHPVIITNPKDIVAVSSGEKVVIAAGYHPGASTDLRAVEIADYLGAIKVVNLSNTDYIYTADPRKDLAAKEIEDMTWAEFRALMPTEWDPGLSTPFDPIAARLADEKGLEVAYINGDDLSELSHYLAGQSFVGTRIHP